MPWPTPGQKAAAAMEPENPDTIDVGSEEIDASDSPPPPNGNGGGEPPRKRKKRD